MDIIAAIKHFLGQDQLVSPVQDKMGGVLKPQTSDEKWQAAGLVKGPDGVWRDSKASPTPTNTNSDMLHKVFGAAPAQAATPAAPVQGTGPQMGGFKYVMGKNDYSDVRPQLQKVLKGTPLEPFTEDFIKAGNAHGVDPRVLVTVANNESSLGKNYPTDTYNPFGYNARGAGTVLGPDGKTYVNVDQGLKDAGFTSLPHAIDALTGRFQRQPTENYKKFYQDPSVENLQAAYNASNDEKDNYIKNSSNFVSQFGQ